ncbi:serine hydrolase domain-containing protein [Fulvivirgaceae bacterium BMA10]|uniref:Serine hydrolase domain-containing protein n=1 Tax=Splendidivirga corallicola TaxID=3051826 RepID=A0ABT8KNH3_9BACT|nr:serine hydrolase domain-containing protein [Fulvivirgaceae bacterium BMA10]
MKKIYVIGFVILSIFPVWKFYDHFSWAEIPLNEQVLTSEGIQSHSYLEETMKARAYLSTLPTKIDVPSVSVSVGINNKIIWSQAVGYANIEEKEKATIQTRYRIGSTSKSLTATGIARLVHRNQLNLDDLVGRSIPNYPMKRWNFTTRQLLSHTAGIGHYQELRGYGAFISICNCRTFETVTKSLNVFNNLQLQYEPGTNFKYSSFDMILASAVIEKRSKQSFLDFMDTEVFVPLNMSSTEGDHSKPSVDHLATFYESKNSRFREWRTLNLVANDINLSYKWAGGGFLSTPTDLVRLGNAWLNDTAFIAKDIRETFFTPQQLKNGKINEQNYALGWRSDKEYQSKNLFDGQKTVWAVHHGGVSQGAMNYLVLFPEYNLTINGTINTNTPTFNVFASEVTKLANFFLIEIDKKNVPPEN